MASTLSFLGAALNVTGSRYVLETDKAKILIDCGMFQDRANLGRNWEDFGFIPQEIDAVLLTHGHLDHCGWLPKLVKEGFRGSVFATSPTVGLVPIILRDSANIQVEDARNKAKRHFKEGRALSRPPEPLYNMDDAEKAISLLRPIDNLGRMVAVAPGINASWGENGHIIGAAWIAVETDNRRIVFSGDVGRWDRPILHDPKPPTAADYLVIESTYGNRTHEATNVREQLRAILSEASEHGGNLLIPSFSVERAQELLYLLSDLDRKDWQRFRWVYLDSPMASKVTELFRIHKETHDTEMRCREQSGDSPFSFDGLKFIATASESKNLNSVKKGAIIIAGNGMCTGGRIKHHLAHNIERPETTVLFVGFQAPGTLGRQLVDGAEEIRLFNRMLKVRAGIRQLYGLSGHADQNELTRWAGHIGKAPRHCFVTHGEPSAAAAFATRLRDKFGWKTSTPTLMDKVTLE